MLNESRKYYGFYRAKVVDNKDPEKRGQVLVWIPDLMPKIPDTEGIWACPVNTLGGRDPVNKETWKQGTCYIPVVGSWVWVFFEGGNPSRPFYFGSIEIEQSRTVVENQLGSEYWNKWTVIRTRQGRVIIISDDPDDARVELTGRKRNESMRLEGDSASVYAIDGNQTVILIDERAGKEKVLIKDWRGNTIHIRSHSDEIHIYANSDIVINTSNNLHIKAAANLDIGVDGDCKIKVGGSMHIKCGEFNVDASTVNEQCGAAQDASPRTTITDRDS